MTIADETIWPVTIRFDQVSDKGFDATETASVDVMARVAAFVGLVDMSHLSYEATIRRWRRTGLQVTGELRAVFRQESVVSLEPFEQKMREPFSAVFVPEGSKLDRISTISTGELVLDPDGDDLPETFDGFELNVGRLVLEFFVLGLDPHPKLPDEVFSSATESDSDDDLPPSPFAGLAALKDK